MRRVSGVDRSRPAAAFFFTDTAPTGTYTLSLHDALPISLFVRSAGAPMPLGVLVLGVSLADRSEEHTSELQSLTNLVCRLLLEKKKTTGRGMGRASRSVRRPRRGRGCGRSGA